MSNVKKTVLSALFIALGIILPQLLHAIPGGGFILLPMHIPVLLCGLICGWQYGFAVGVLTPVLSGLITGMPGIPMMPAMAIELGVYGLVSGAIMSMFKNKGSIAAIYVALVNAMLCGRIAFGAVNALFFRAGDYSLQIWLTSSLVTPWIGIAIQLVLIPVIVAALRRARLMY